MFVYNAVSRPVLAIAQFITQFINILKPTGNYTYQLF
jgi:hypothetical protein